MMDFGMFFMDVIVRNLKRFFMDGRNEFNIYVLILIYVLGVDIVLNIVFVVYKNMLKSVLFMVFWFLELK